MANYQQLLSEVTLKVLAPDVVYDAQRVTARALDTGALFATVFYPFPTSPTGEVVWNGDLMARELTTEAERWNTNARVPGVVAISPTQHIDSSGNLVDVALVTVSSTSGNSSTVLTLYERDWLEQLFVNQIEYWRLQLDVAEGAA